MDHLDEVAGAVGADVGDARLAFGDGGDRFENGLERDPGLGRAAGHDRGAEQGTLLTAGDAGADEVDARLAHGLLAADRIGEESVASVDDDVARLEDLGEGVDDGVGAAPGLHHDDGGARLLQGGGELGVVLRGDEAGFGVLGEEGLGLLVGAVVDSDRVALATGEVAGQVRPHDGESDDSDVGGGLGHGELLRVWGG